MIIIEYFDWLGTSEGLEEYCSAVKKAVSDTPDAKYIGTYRPLNNMHTHSLFFEVKDFATLDKVYHNFHYKRDRKTLPHVMQEFFIT
jgi:hypothetical protein